MALPTESQPDDRLYFPPLDEPQLTARAVMVGCLVGSVVSCTNIYIGLKIGWSFGASIIAAVLGYAVFAGSSRKLSVLETNIAQTAGSAAGYMSSAAGLLAAIPALQMLGYEFAWHVLMLWAVSVAFLGIFFAVPLRRQMVLVERLRFPSGTATAQTILAMHSEAAEATSKAKALLGTALAALLFSLAAYFVHPLEEPPLAEWTGSAWLLAAAAWGFKLNFGPALFGAGFLIGPRVVLSLVLGAVLGWGILGPYVQSEGWAPGPVRDYATGPRGWILWPGVALMVSEALTSLALSWRTFVRALLPRKSEAEVDDRAASEAIPNSWWMGGLAIGSLFTMTMAQVVFEIQWYLTLVAIALSSVLAIVAVRSQGETDINPVGGMGKVTQLVFGGLAPGQMKTNLLAAAITGAGASQASDMMQDLKTGHLLGAAPQAVCGADLRHSDGSCVCSAGLLYIFTRLRHRQRSASPGAGRACLEGDGRGDVGGLGRVAAACVPGGIGGWLFGSAVCGIAFGSRPATLRPKRIGDGHCFHCIRVRFPDDVLWVNCMVAVAKDCGDLGRALYLRRRVGIDCGGRVGRVD